MYLIYQIILFNECSNTNSPWFFSTVEKNEINLSLTKRDISTFIKAKY